MIPDESLSETKFRAFISAFKPSGSISKRAALNAFIASSRKTWGSIFLTTEFGIYSTDDDKQKSRSLLCKDEGFVRKRHDVSGGYGPVMHMVVSQLSGYVLGTGLNAQGGSDMSTLKQMYAEMSGHDCVDDLNLRGMQNEFDRGYKQPAFIKKLSDVWNGKHRGTHPRSSNKESFPYTFGHPNDSRNIIDDGM